MRTQEKVFLLIKISTVAVFLGRSFQFFFRDAPLRVLLWDEELMSPLLSAFGIAWENYATSTNTDANILFFQKAIGVLFLMAAIMSFRIKNSFVFSFIYFLSVAFLILLAFCEMKDKFFHLAQFFEYAIQIGSPLLLFFFHKIEEKKLILTAKILCALTFTCHGLYAVGFYTTPVEYISMTMNGFNFDEKTAKNFLYYAGIFDFLASILIFLPKSEKITLTYMIVWGFLTSMARVYGYYHEGLFLTIFQQYWFHVLYRFGHFLLPLAVRLNPKNY